MKNLSLGDAFIPAGVFRALAVVAGLGTAGYLLLVDTRAISPLLVGLMALGVATEYLSVRIPGIGQVSVSLLPALLALGLVGPAEAVLVVATGSFFGSGLLHRRGFLDSLFIVGKGSLASIAGCILYVVATRTLGPWPARLDLVAVLGVYAVVFSLTETAYAGLAVAQWRRRSVVQQELPGHADLMTNLLLVPTAAALVHIYGLVGSLTFAFGLAALLGAIAFFHALMRIDASRQDIMTLYEASGHLASTLDIESVLKLLTGRLINLVKADSGVSFILDDTTGELVPLASGQAGRFGARLSQNLGRDALLRAARRTAPEASILPAGEGGLDRARKPEYLLLLPLHYDSKALGLVALARHGKGFFADDLRLVAILTGHAITALRNARLYQEIERLSQTDALTGLLNVRRFESLLNVEMRRAERFAHPLSLLMADLDHFKLCNDQYGHETGNAVLRELALLLTSCVREVDAVCRYGGEEFVVLLPETNQTQAVTVAERIRLVVGGHSFQGLGNESLTVTLSLGVASYPEDATEPHLLIQSADGALYRAKQAGRNRVCFAGMDSTAGQSTFPNNSEEPEPMAGSGRLAKEGSGA